jgi:hypothetical protein
VTLLAPEPVYGKTVLSNEFADLLDSYIGLPSWYGLGYYTRGMERFFGYDPAREYAELLVAMMDVLTKWRPGQSFEIHDGRWAFRGYADREHSLSAFGQTRTEAIANALIAAHDAGLLQEGGR